jgi:hypothetical protein
MDVTTIGCYEVMSVMIRAFKVGDGSGGLAIAIPTWDCMYCIEQ